MTVASEITRIYGVRSNIFDAITAKGVTVPEGSKLADCPTLIGQITGGDEPVPEMPAMTLRLLFPDGVTPTFSKGTATQVSASPNIWDLYYNNTDWSQLCYNQYTLLKVIAVGDTSTVTDMTNLFGNCNSLESVPLFDTSSVTSMDYMFQYDGTLTSIPQFNTSSVTRMQGMFRSCYALRSVPLLDMSNVTLAGTMFQYCSALNSVPLFDFSSLTSASGMFQYCYSLINIPLFNTENVTNMAYMFSTCLSVSKIPLLNTTKATAMHYMFDGCKNVTQGALALYQQAANQTTPPTSHSYTFRNCGSNTVSGAAELAQIPSSWGGTAA